MNNCNALITIKNYCWLFVWGWWGGAFTCRYKSLSNLIWFLFVWKNQLPLKDFFFLFFLLRITQLWRTFSVFFLFFFFDNLFALCSISCLNKNVMFAFFCLCEKLFYFDCRRRIQEFINCLFLFYFLLRPFLLPVTLFLPTYYVVFYCLLRPLLPSVT